jgi:hypothetical protein
MYSSNSPRVQGTLRRRVLWVGRKLMTLSNKSRPLIVSLPQRYLTLDSFRWSLSSVSLMKTARLPFDCYDFGRCCPAALLWRQQHRAFLWMRALCMCHLPSSWGAAESGASTLEEILRVLAFKIQMRFSAAMR